jgi:hypothetical protein
MAKPVIESGDITTTTGTGTTAALDTPAYVSGDLLIAFLGIDDDVTANNPQNPATGPFGETLIYDLAGSGGSSASGPTQCAVAWVGTATRAADTIDFTWTGDEFWAGRVIKVLAGEFDATTPLGAASGFAGNTSSTGTTVPTPVWTLDADDGGGAILVHMVVDADPLSGTPGGWTLTVNTDHGGLATAITQRDAESVDSETTVSVDYTVSSDSSSTLGIVIRALSGASISNVDSDYGAASDEFDVDENSLDVNGTGFESTQGTGTVWLADETTLVASNAEVDLADAINTWGDLEVNLNLPNLGATEKTNIEALIVSDGPALFIILVNNSSEETSLPVTVHRAKAFAMSLSANIATSGENTTGQLTAPASGSFGGGRIQDDENPADTVDIGDDEFFEDEWCIEALTASVYTETYLFRVLIAGAPAATITVTPGLTVEVAAGGAIDAALPIVSAVIADLKGDGKLDAAMPIVTAVVADLKATGALDALLPIVTDVVADLKATGALDAALPIEFNVVADLKATGKLDAVLPVVFAVVADLKAQGKLDAALPIEFNVVADLVAQPVQIEAVLPIVFAVVADLKAQGKLDAALAIVLALVADLKGAGKLDAVLPIEFNVVAELEQPGGIDAVAAMVFDITADLKAQGKLDAALAIEFAVAADLKAEGKLDALLAIIFNVVADLRDEGGGRIDAVLPIVFDVVADLKARGKLDALLGMELAIVANLQAEGKLDATLPIVTAVVANLQAQGRLDATLAIVLDVAADLKAQGDLAAAAAIVFNVVANLADQQGPIEAVLPIEFGVAASLTAVPVVADDGMADPREPGWERRPRFYAKRWNMFAETFDAFLRRQETLVRETVLEVEELEDVMAVVFEDQGFVEELDVMTATVAETVPVTSAELLDALHADVVELIQVIRNEEDIIALVTLIASDDTIIH